MVWDATDMQVCNSMEKTHERLISTHLSAHACSYAIALRAPAQPQARTSSKCLRTARASEEVPSAAMLRRSSSSDPALIRRRFCMDRYSSSAPSSTSGEKGEVRRLTASLHRQGPPALSAVQGRALSESEPRAQGQERGFCAGQAGQTVAQGVHRQLLRSPRH